MSIQERLGFLLSYHHNLSIQLLTTKDKEREKLNVAIVNLEEEIDSLLWCEV